LMDRVDREKDVLRCLDLDTGKELWAFTYDAPGPIDHEGSRSTPAITDKFVFTIGPFGHFHCIDRPSPQLFCQMTILSDYRTKLPRWAVAQSPLLYKDLVIAAPQADDSGIVAFDQASGNKKWQSESIGPMAYGSPMLMNLEGVDQVVIVNNLGAAAV